MKKHIRLMFLFFIIGNIGALDTDSYEFNDRLLGVSSAGRPEIIEDGVLFTAPSSYRSVGIAFAHEDFTSIYWFRKLLVLAEQGPPPANGKQPPPKYGDSGVLFFAYTPPENIRTLEYRLIINGLWTTDPYNPLRREDAESGIHRSVVILPEIKRTLTVFEGAAGSLNFRFTAPPGETITVAGDFNGWDPFMHTLAETAPGRYSLALPLPAGTYHYIFYYRGSRVTDPNNRNTVYDKYGNPVSEAVLK
ncbi:MAG: isoamylase [Spirochaetaceae bacterium]|jgi:hypothetical protein|nr:isoamylase [Spirochaetaceae bacterium]